MFHNVQRAEVARIEFIEPLLVYKTDRIEVDPKIGRAYVVNSAGKIKQSVGFKVFGVPDGASATTGD
jgi:hypothetical protein